MTDQTLPVCRLCKCVAADYKNPGEDVKHHCANDHCTLHMVLMTPEQWTALMGVAGPIDPIASIEAVGMVDIVNTGRGKHAIYTNLDPAFDLPAGRHKLYTQAPAVDGTVIRDAARYRWLRDPCSGAERVVMYSRGDYGRGLMSYTMLDNAIDSAMGEQQ